MSHTTPSREFKISYGTYGIPKLSAFEAIPRLARIGYQGIEICVGANYPTAPANISQPERNRLRSLLRDLDLALPALMLINHPLEQDPARYRTEVAALRASAALAVELSSVGDVPVLATTAGGGPDEWEDKKDLMVERVAEWGRICAEYGTKLAIEPHFGSALNTPERTLWLIKRINSPDVQINFDISHFIAGGFDLEETIAALAPISIHTHVKDGRVESGRVRYLLPGDGGIDYVKYYRAMAKAGWFGHICVEITAQIFNLPDYDPWSAAEKSYRVLRQSLEQAKPF